MLRHLTKVKSLEENPINHNLEMSKIEVWAHEPGR